MRQSGGRILLGDNTGGGVVMLGVGVWISMDFIVYTYTYR